MACTILERTSGLEPPSKQTAPMDMKLGTVPNFCPFTFIFLWMPFALFVISLVFSALISILYLAQNLSGLSSRVSSSCSSSARASLSSANRKLGNIFAAYANLPIMFFQDIRHDPFVKKCRRGWLTEDILALLRLLFRTILLCCHSSGLHL